VLALMTDDDLQLWEAVEHSVREQARRVQAGTVGKGQRSPVRFWRWVYSLSRMTSEGAAAGWMYAGRSSSVKTFQNSS
jgi:hypothetical protein